MGILLPIVYLKFCYLLLGFFCVDVLLVDKLVGVIEVKLPSVASYVNGVK